MKDILKRKLLKMLDEGSLGPQSEKATIQNALDDIVETTDSSIEQSIDRLKEFGYSKFTGSGPFTSVVSTELDYVEIRTPGEDVYLNNKNEFVEGVGTNNLVIRQNDPRKLPRAIPYIDSDEYEDHKYYVLFDQFEYMINNGDDTWGIKRRNQPIINVHKNQYALVEYNFTEILPNSPILESGDTFSRVDVNFETGKVTVYWQDTNYPPYIYNFDEIAVIPRQFTNKIENTGRGTVKVDGVMHTYNLFEPDEKDFDKLVNNNDGTWTLTYNSVDRVISNNEFMIVHKGFTNLRHYDGTVFATYADGTHNSYVNRPINPYTFESIIDLGNGTWHVIETAGGKFQAYNEDIYLFIRRQGLISLEWNKTTKALKVNGTSTTPNNFMEYMDVATSAYNTLLSEDEKQLSTTDKVKIINKTASRGKVSVKFYSIAATDTDWIITYEVKRVIYNTSSKVNINTSDPHNNIFEYQVKVPIDTFIILDANDTESLVYKASNEWVLTHDDGSTEHIGVYNFNVISDDFEQITDIGNGVWVIKRPDGHFDFVRVYDYCTFRKDFLVAENNFDDTFYINSDVGEYEELISDVNTSQIHVEVGIDNYEGVYKTGLMDGSRPVYRVKERYIDIPFQKNELGNFAKITNTITGTMVVDMVDGTQYIHPQNIYLAFDVSSTTKITKTAAGWIDQNNNPIEPIEFDSMIRNTGANRYEVTNGVSNYNITLSSVMIVRHNFLSIDVTNLLLRKASSRYNLVTSAIQPSATTLPIPVDAEYVKRINDDYYNVVYLNDNKEYVSRSALTSVTTKRMAEKVIASAERTFWYIYQPNGTVDTIVITPTNGVSNPDVRLMTAQEYISHHQTHVRLVDTKYDHNSMLDLPHNKENPLVVGAYDLLNGNIDDMNSYDSLGYNKETIQIEPQVINTSMNIYDISELTINNNTLSQFRASLTLEEYDEENIIRDPIGSFSIEPLVIRDIVTPSNIMVYPPKWDATTGWDDGKVIHNFDLTADFVGTEIYIKNHNFVTGDKVVIFADVKDTTKFNNPNRSFIVNVNGEFVTFKLYNTPVVFDIDELLNEIPNSVMPHDKDIRTAYGVKMNFVAITVNPIPEDVKLTIDVKNYDHYYNRFLNGGSHIGKYTRSSDHIIISGNIDDHNIKLGTKMKFHDSDNVYYAIPVNIQTFKLAASLDDALNGVSVNTSGINTDLSVVEFWLTGTVTTERRSYKWYEDNTETDTTLYNVSHGYARPLIDSGSLSEKVRMSSSEHLSITVWEDGKAYALETGTRDGLKWEMYEMYDSDTGYLNEDLYYDMNEVSVSQYFDPAYLININGEYIRFNECTGSGLNWTIKGLIRGQHITSEWVRHDRGDRITVIRPIDSYRLYPGKITSDDLTNHSEGADLEYTTVINKHLLFHKETIIKGIGSKNGTITPLKPD